MTKNPIIKNILLIEDNPSHQDLMRVAFEENNILHNLHIVSNGPEALIFLRYLPPYANEPQPDLIFLDFDLPGMRGHEILEIIKQDITLKIIPVVVFTSSGKTKDIIQSYSLKANCYLQKPFELEDFLTIVPKTLNFWLDLANFPERHVW
jgi:two-component system, chemotaxis family, response regulator Rcp1